MSVQLFTNVVIHTLFDQTCRSPESMGSTTRVVSSSTPCYSDVLSPSQTGYTKREFIMMAPEEKLRHFDSRAQAREDSQEVSAL